MSSELIHTAVWVGVDRKDLEIPAYIEKHPTFSQQTGVLLYGKGPAYALYGRLVTDISSLVGAESLTKGELQKNCEFLSFIGVAIHKKFYEIPEFRDEMENLVNKYIPGEEKCKTN